MCDNTQRSFIERYRFIEDNDIEDSFKAEEASVEILEKSTNTNALKYNNGLLAIFIKGCEQLGG